MTHGVFDLAGRKALVTGAATGLGQAITVALARAGADVALSDKPGVSLEDTHARAAIHGRHLYLHAMDVRDLAAVQAGVAAAEEALGRIDIVVSNAGINRPTESLDVDEGIWDDHFSTNVRGGFFVARAAAGGMIRRGFGRVIFIASQSGLVGIPGQPVYCATQGALVNLVRAMGVEWARHGLTVNAVAPTFIETNLTRKRLQNPDFRKFVLGKIPCGRLAEPADVAHAVIYLASTEAGMVNCTTLCVDGGWTAW